MKSYKKIQISEISGNDNLGPEEEKQIWSAFFDILVEKINIQKNLPKKIKVGEDNSN